MLVGLVALLPLIVGMNSYINTDVISMVLVGYLVDAAPQVLVWWGGFQFHSYYLA